VRNLLSTILLAVGASVASLPAQDNVQGPGSNSPVLGPPAAVEGLAAQQTNSQIQVDKETAAAAERERIFRLAPVDPFRSFKGETVAANGPGWAKFWGKVVVIKRPAIGLNGGFTNENGGFTGFFVVDNFPRRVVAGQLFEFAQPWWARIDADISDGTTNYHVLNYEVVFPLKEPPQGPPAQAAADKKADLAARALAANQTAAENGDAYGEFRMGERYRDGDGVPKDPAKAREWFAKAAAHGDAAAQRALDHLQN